MKKIILITSCEHCPYYRPIIKGIWDCTKLNQKMQNNDFETYCPLSNLSSLEEEILCQVATKEDDKISLVVESWKAQKQMQSQDSIRGLFGAFPTLTRFTEDFENSL